MKWNILQILGLSTFLLSCDLDSPEINQYVIEGYLIAGERVDNILVKETSSLNEDQVGNTPIENAMVVISSPETSVTLTYDPISGKYVDELGDLEVNVASTYQIDVVVDGSGATGSTIVPEVPTGLSLPDTEFEIPTLTLNFGLAQQFQELFAEQTSTLTWDGVPGRSYYVVIENKEETLDPILPDGIPQESLDLISSFRFISEPSEETSFEIIAVALETYGRHLAKVYTVNEEYVELFNSDVQDSRDLNEPPSNINNALGIFTAFAVDSVEFIVVRPE